MKNLIKMLSFSMLWFSCENSMGAYENETFSGIWYVYKYKQCESLNCQENCDTTIFPMIAECEIINVEKWTFNNNNNTFTIVSPYQSCNEDGSWNISENVETLNWTQSGNTLYLEHPDGDEPILESTGFEIQYIQNDSTLTDSLHLQMVITNYSMCLEYIMSKNKYFDYEYDN